MIAPDLAPAVAPDDLGEIALRLIAATLAGAALGINRELHDKPAGLRTHALVSLGSAVITVCALELASVRGAIDPNAVSRVVQGLLAGVGFIGGGTILRDTSARSVHGLTTAATIWIVATLGVVCGSGYWIIALVGVLLALLVLAGGAGVEAWLRRSPHRAPGAPPEPDP
jgi:putative Mg2+ transporter-C (MgtC) family protein